MKSLLVLLILITIEVRYIRVFLLFLIIGVFFFITYSLASYSSISKSKGSKIASSLIVVVIVNNLIFSSNSILVIIRVSVFDRYKPRNSRRRIIVLLSI